MITYLCDNCGKRGEDPMCPVSIELYNEDWLDGGEDQRDLIAFSVTFELCNACLKIARKRLPTDPKIAGEMRSFGLKTLFRKP